MKKIKLLLAALLIAGFGLFVASCSSDNDDPAVQLSVSPLSVSFVAAGGEQALTVTTAAKTWSHKASDGATWLTATKVDNKINVTATAHTGTAARTATITVSAVGAKDVVVNVTQAIPVGPSLSVTPATATIVAAGGEALFTVTTNIAAWTFVKTVGADWLTVTKVGETQLKAVATNYASTTENRTATITVSAAGVPDVVVNVTQTKFVEGGDLYETLPHNYNFTGTPGFATNPGPPSWATPMIKVANLEEYLIEYAGMDLDNESTPGSKYLVFTSWMGGTNIMILELTKEGTLLFPEIAQFMQPNIDLGGGVIADLYGLQVALGKSAEDGKTYFAPEREIPLIWDDATKTLSSPVTMDLVIASKPKATYTISFGILAFRIVGEQLEQVGVFGDAYSKMSFKQSSPLRAPEYTAPTASSRLQNLADSPYREVQFSNSPVNGLKLMK